MSIWNELCKIGKQCCDAATKEYNIFKEECCDNKSIIECAKDSKEYKDIINNLNKLKQKRK